MVAQATGMDGRGNKIMPKRVHFDDRRHLTGITVIEGINPWVRDGVALGSTARSRVRCPSRRFWRKKGKAMPEKFDPPPTQPMTTSGYSPAMIHLFERFFPDDRLVQQDMVQHRTQAVFFRPTRCGSYFNRF